uniref:Uncharacterized protein n=1 Tax=Cacopsylla melanoneura TaxID=428564 RepID=A0A8D8ZKT9_9HEMI
MVRIALKFQLSLLETCSKRSPNFCRVTIKAGSDPSPRLDGSNCKVSTESSGWVDWFPLQNTETESSGWVNWFQLLSFYRNRIFRLSRLAPNIGFLQEQNLLAG